MSTVRVVARLRGQHELVAAVADELTDRRLALAIARRGVEEVHSGVQVCV
jgi:hypothetical protein